MNNQRLHNLLSALERGDLDLAHVYNVLKKDEDIHVATLKKDLGIIGIVVIVTIAFLYLSAYYFFNPCRQ